MSDRSFIRPVRIPGKRFVLTKGMIEESQKHTKSNMEAARWLKVSCVGVKKGWATYKIKLEDIFEGKRKCNYTLPMLKKRMIEEGYAKEECYSCGWNEGRVTDGKIPLTIDFVDGESENKSLDNMRLLCPNCYFVHNGFFNNSNKFVK
jgi:hypothetical protein